MQGKEKKRSKITNLPTIVTARRALGITKMYVAITAFFIILATVAWNPANYVSTSGSSNSTSNSSTALGTVASTVASTISSSSKSSIFLLAVPLYTIPLLMLEIPVLILFVYDKNNGVLEYFLSLGMTQKEIFKRYLKASLILSMVAIAIFVPLNMLYTFVVYGATVFSEILPVYPLAVLFSLSIVSFLAMLMMSFSTLQKTRAGGNQPLGLTIGYAATIPGYIAVALPLNIAIHFDIAVVIVIAAATLAMFRSSDKFIRRENFLP